MRRYIMIAAIAVAAGLGLSYGTAAATGTTTVGLHNTTAGSGSCPVSGPNGVWHFVSTPNNDTEIVAIKLKLDGTWVTINSWTASPKPSHAYVVVPSGYTLSSLQDGEFKVTGTDDDVKLSHTCAPTVVTTTTVPQSTTTAATTTTVQQTTTTVNQTTTTTGQSTTTTSGDSTTTTVNDTTTTVTNSTIPKTGAGGTAGMTLAALLLVGAGVATALLARRSA